jgi:hypothetical protein
LVPEQYSDRLQAGELCFARLIGLLLEDPRQRSANRAPSTAGGCNALTLHWLTTPSGGILTPLASEDQEDSTQQ